MKTFTKKTLNIFWEHDKKYGRITLLILVSLVFARVAELFAPVLYGRFFNVLTQTRSGNIQSVVPQLVSTLVLILFTGIIAWAFWRVVVFSSTSFQARALPELANTCFAYIHLHSYRFFANTFVGSLVKKVTRFTRAFEGIFDLIVWEICPLAVDLTGMLIVLFIKNRTMAFLLLGWSAVFMVINYFFTRYKLRYDIASNSADTKTTAHLADTITNSINVKLFSGSLFELNAFKALTKHQFRLKKKAWTLDALLESGQAFLMIGLEFLMFYIGIRLWQEGRFSVGDFVIIQMYLITLFRNIWHFGRMIRHLYEFLADAEEMTEIFETPHEIVDAPRAQKLMVTRGEIVLNGVRFGYEKGKNVFPEISLKIKAQEKVALIGPSGSGKSSFVKLLFRFFDLKKGQIFIDGQNIKLVTQESLREHISLVPQEPILFHRSLFENIRYGNRDVSDEAVYHAARLAHAHEFIIKFSKGYETLVGERGIKLSGGERQRIAIARAILKNAPILVLDEATSSLDSESESAIQDALKTLMEGRTVIVIAHRLSTIMKMDRIIVMRDGGIEEEGTHAELLKKDGSLYRRLWKLQAQGFIA